MIGSPSVSDSRPSILQTYFRLSVLGLPVFVIASTSHTKRDIHLGWVVDWDDRSKQFLISFDDDTRVGNQLGTNQLESMHDEEPFLAFEIKAGKVRTIAGRQGQQRFKFQVFKRYGPQCAVCGLAILELLQAAHLIPKESKGSDDPRNGLVLCANHHVAFDADLFGIEPGTLKVYYKESGPDAEALRIVAGNLQHLSRKPHADALKWRFDLWSQGQHANQLPSSTLENVKSP
jgi:putative restriction endonuclease